MRLTLFFSALLLCAGTIGFSVPSSAQDIFVRQGDGQREGGSNKLYLPPSTNKYTPSPNSNRTFTPKVFTQPKASDAGISRGQGTSSRNNLDEVQRINIAHASRQAEQNQKIIEQRQQEWARIRAKADEDLIARVNAERLQQANNATAKEDLPPEFRTDAASIDVGEQKIYINKGDDNKKLDKPNRIFNIFE